MPIAPDLTWYVLRDGFLSFRQFPESVAPCRIRSDLVDDTWSIARSDRPNPHARDRLSLLVEHRAPQPGSGHHRQIEWRRVSARFDPD